MTSCALASTRRFALLVVAALSATSVSADTAQQFLSACPLGASDCSYYQSQLRSQFPAALKGDYTAQRNVAYMLQDREPGHAPGITKNDIEACAWRVVIMNSRHREVDSSDQSNLLFGCRRLGGADRIRALARAEELMLTIYRRPLPGSFKLPS